MSSTITVRSRCHTYPHEWHVECFRYTHNGEIKTLSWREIKAIEKGLKERQNDLLTTTEGRAWSLAKEDVCSRRNVPTSNTPHSPTVRRHSGFSFAQASRRAGSGTLHPSDRHISYCAMSYSQVLCQPCNLRKGVRSNDQFMEHE